VDDTTQAPPVEPVETPAAEAPAQAETIPAGTSLFDIAAPEVAEPEAEPEPDAEPEVQDDDDSEPEAKPKSAAGSGEAQTPKTDVDINESGSLFDL